MPTVAITGAAGAIGSTTADVFAEAGWDLALLDYGEDNRAALEEAHPEALAIDCDLTDAEATRAAFQRIAEESGGVTATLAIAGGFSMQVATEATRADYDRMMGMNFETLFNTTRAALPHLTSEDEGFLLGVSAPAAEEGQAQAGLYAASKAAVAAYLQSVAAEVEDDGVRVSVLYPMGVVDTPANRDAMPDADPASWIAPQELAESMHHAATRSARGHVPELKVHAVGRGD